MATLEYGGSSAELDEHETYVLRQAGIFSGDYQPSDFVQRLEDLVSNNKPNNGKISQIKDTVYDLICLAQLKVEPPIIVVGGINPSKRKRLKAAVRKEPSNAANPS